MVAVNYDWDELEDNIDEEYDDAGIAVAEYTTEPGQFGNVVSQRRSDQSSYFHYDGLGSTFALTNGGAAVIDTYAFTATGEATFVAGGTVNPYRYLGRVGYLFDAVSEAVSVRRRTLLSGTARWLAVDPNPLRAYVVSTYAYVLNKPTLLADPSGLQEAAAGKGTCSVRLCANPIEAVAGAAVHLYVVIEVRAGVFKVFRGGPGHERTEGGCDCSANQPYGQLLGDYGDYEEGGIDWPPDGKHNCKNITVANSDCEALQSCFISTLDAINRCCINYKPVPVFGVFGACNSNCVAFWLLKNCISREFLPDTPVFVPGLRTAPGWFSPRPRCITQPTVPLRPIPGVHPPDRGEPGFIPPWSPSSPGGDPGRKPPFWYLYPPYDTPHWRYPPTSPHARR